MAYKSRSQSQRKKCKFADPLVVQLALKSTTLTVAIIGHLRPLSSKDNFGIDLEINYHTYFYTTTLSKLPYMTNLSKKIVACKFTVIIYTFKVG